MKFKNQEKQSGSINWLGLGSQTALLAVRSANFAMRQMIITTAGRLDVAESQVKVAFGRQMGEWGWSATVHRNGTEHIGPACADPMHAMAALVDRMQEKGG